MSVERALGSLEGKLDLVISELGEIKNTAETRTKALHDRVDKHSDRISTIERDSAEIRKDLKWFTVIFIGIVSTIKWGIAKFKLLF